MLRSTVLFGLVLTFAAPTLAQEADEEVSTNRDNDLPPVAARPTSSAASLLSGRTLGVGEAMIAGAIGWPGIWARLELAPTSTLNVGVRAAMLWGSTILSLEPAAGGELAIPIRIHLHGEDIVDIAIQITPAVVVAEGAGVGEGGSAFAGAFGYSVRGEAGIRLGIAPSEDLTIVLGLDGLGGVVHTPDAGGPEAVGGVFGTLGVEGLVSRDTMLFALFQGGLGFTPDRGGFPVFRETVPPLVRLSLGLAYLL